jgi:LPS-assembly protein
MIRLFAKSIFLVCLTVLWCGNSAMAASTTDNIAQGVSKNKPVLLTAKQVGYDQPNSTAIAIGNVEVVQGDTILLADKVTYNQKTDVVHAIGHVSIVQPSGDVFFANDAILANQLQKGVIQQFRARLKDDSLFAASEAERLSKNVVVMKNVVYSPCKVCAQKANEAAQPPIWQVEARKATLDDDAQRVTYRDAFIDVYGVPIIYTPYFSHPSPDAPSQSGLLTPQYFHATDLGNVVKQPVYISIAPNMDMTLTPWYLSGEKPLLQAEFRHLTQNGSYELRGAITETYARDVNGSIIPGDQTRGYIDAHGRFQLDPHWDAGVDAERTSDNTFLQFYRLGGSDILLSRLYAERIEDRSYVNIESLAFQGLQPQDISSQSPYILPQANFHFESDPLIAHSRLQIDGNTLVLERQEGNTDQRVSGTVGWKLPYITPGGQVFETKASLRADAYHINDQATSTAPNANFDGSLGRFIPEVDFNWRYPLINRFGDGHSLMLAPVAEISASPNLHNSSEIPNEDSQVAELNSVNLFSPNRYTGLDAVESGLRGVYGLRGQLQLENEKYFEWLLGQAYEKNHLNSFPIANDLSSNVSDYIGRIALKYKWLDASYDFRLDRETMSPISNEVIAGFTLAPVYLNFTYVALKDEPLFGDRQEVFGDATLDVTPNWRWTLSGRRDLGSSEQTPTSIPLPYINPLIATQGTVGASTGITFHDECMTITSTLGRSYISIQDVKPSTTFSVLLVLKNFGASGVTTAQTLTTPAVPLLSETSTLYNPADSLNNANGGGK